MPFSGFDDLNPEFSSRLQAFVAASGGRISITSGFRSTERQQQLWQQALAKYGDPEIADNWVARPGKSHHNHGIAADLGFSGPDAREWAHNNAGRFGLFFPMDWEPWHIEPTGIQSGADPGAYTTPPTGYENPAVVEEDPYDPGVQMGRLMGALMTGPQQVEGAAAEAQDIMATPTLPGPSNEPEAQVAEIAGGTQGGDIS